MMKKINLLVSMFFIILYHMALFGGYTVSNVVSVWDFILTFFASLTVESFDKSTFIFSIILFFKITVIITLSLYPLAYEVIIYSPSLINCTSLIYP